MPNQNKLYFGDNLDILRDKIGDSTVDLIYLDPPFQSGRSYNQIFNQKAEILRALPLKSRHLRIPGSGVRKPKKTTKV